MKLLDNFWINFNKLLKESKKLKEENPFKTQEDVLAFFKNITQLTWVNILTENKDLHVLSIGVIDTIMDISKKRKFKEKYIETFLQDIKEIQGYCYLIEHSEEYQSLKDIEIKEYGHEKVIWMRNPWSVKNSIEKYCDLLLSKTVDYIPEVKQTNQQMSLVLDIFDGFKEKLLNIAEGFDPVWVYNLTESYHYTPFSLRYLDSLNQIGDKLTNWIDYSRESKVVQLCNERGYSVFGGWGNLSKQLMLVGNTLEEDKPMKYRPPMNKESVDRIIQTCMQQVPMFAMNPRFNIFDAEMKTLFLQMMATWCYNDEEIDDTQIQRIVSSCRDLMKKHYRQIYMRDKRAWFMDEDVKHIKTFVHRLYKYRWEQYCTLILKVIFDFATPATETECFWDLPDADIIQLHDFICVSYNMVYHSVDKFSLDEINQCLKYTQQYLIQRFKPLIPKVNQWMLNAGVELWLDIENPERVADNYRVLSEHFSRRNTKELNEEFYHKNKFYLILMGYTNKKALLDKLTQEPIDLVSYNGSKEIYNTMIGILKKDIDDPIKTHRVNPVEVTEQGIKSKMKE